MCRWFQQSIARISRAWPTSGMITVAPLFEILATHRSGSRASAKAFQGQVLLAFAFAPSSPWAFVIWPWGLHARARAPPRVF
eukprot:2464160-Lingulodinium_polyedra.AAC.1